MYHVLLPSQATSSCWQTDGNVTMAVRILQHASTCRDESVLSLLPQHVSDQPAYQHDAAVLE